MKYVVHNEFISSEICKNLIKESDEVIEIGAVAERHGGRFTLPSSDLQFSKLYNESPVWKEILDKINSDEFLKFCCDELGIDKTTISRVEHYNSLNPSKFRRHFKLVGNGRVHQFNNLKLLQYIIYRVLRKLEKFFKFIKYYFFRSLPVELLFDYSIATNGYWREIHRDSDARLIVFLLFLSGMPEDAEGGTLDLYEYDGTGECIPSRPNDNECSLIESISPQIGQLVIFRNSSDALHAVPEMINHKSKRYFLYGSFTLLSGKNKELNNSCDKLDTPFDLYL